MPTIASPLALRDAAVKHSWQDVPQGWERHSVPSPDHVVNLQIGLKQHRFEELAATLYEISDPYHERYGQHLTKA